MGLPGTVRRLQGLRAGFTVLSTGPGAEALTRSAAGNPEHAHAPCPLCGLRFTCMLIDRNIVVTLAEGDRFREGRVSRSCR